MGIKTGGGLGVTMSIITIFKFSMRADLRKMSKDGIKSYYFLFQYCTQGLMSKTKHLSVIFLWEFRTTLKRFLILATYLLNMDNHKKKIPVEFNFKLE